MMSSNLLRNGFFCVLLMLTQRAYCSPLTAFGKHVNQGKPVTLVLSNSDVESLYEDETVESNVKSVLDMLDTALETIKAATLKLKEVAINSSPSKQTQNKNNEAEIKTLLIKGDDGLPHKKYHIIYDKKMNFFDASSVCKSKGYSLASFEGKNEFYLLTQHLTENYRMNDRLWTSGNNLEDSGKFYWESNGSPVPLGEEWWWEGEPSGDGEHCLELAGEGTFKPHDPKPGFKLNDGLCSDEKYPVCEEVIELPVKSDDTVSADPKTVTVTGENGVVYKIYHIIDDSEATFKGASKVCKSSDSSYVLASIKNQKEFDLLSAHLAEYYKITDRFWTSGNDFLGEYHWGPKGSYASISPEWWWEGEPNNGEKDTTPEHCIELVQFDRGSKPEFKLNDAPCPHKKYSICEEIVHQLSDSNNCSTATEEPEDPKTVFVTGEDGISYKKYYILDKKESFQDAYETCFDLSFSKSESVYLLASIQNQKEFDVLTKHLKKHYKNIDSFWTSGNDMIEEGQFLWISDYRNNSPNEEWWWSGEPDNGIKNGVEEDCIEISQFLPPDFKLNDASCRDKKYPICEERIQPLVTTDYSVILNESER